MACFTILYKESRLKALGWGKVSNWAGKAGMVRKAEKKIYAQLGFRLKQGLQLDRKSWNGWKSWKNAQLEIGLEKRENHFIVLQKTRKAGKILLSL